MSQEAYELREAEFFRACVETWGPDILWDGEPNPWFLEFLGIPLPDFKNRNPRLILETDEGTQQLIAAVCAGEIIFDLPQGCPVKPLPPPLSWLY